MLLQELLFKVIFFFFTHFYLKNKTGMSVHPLLLSKEVGTVERGLES